MNLFWRSPHRGAAEGWGLPAVGVGLATLLFISLALPLVLMVGKSLTTGAGEFIGLASYREYLDSPRAWVSMGNTLFVGVASTVLTVPLAFVYAYAIHRACLPAKGLFRAVALVPLLTPSLLFALSLVQLFGNQGLFKGWISAEALYGPWGIVVGMTFAHFPHTFMVLSAALLLADRRHYEAAASMGTPPWRVFWTLTLPAVKYGLISACIISFMLSITDFGIPKVIGGSYAVLATDIYKQVIGQQNFQLGAVISVVLLLAAAATFVLARLVQQQQTHMVSGQAVPLQPRPHPLRDGVLLVFCTVVALAIVGVLLVALVSSFIKFWPYNLNFTWKHYNFDLAAGGGWQAYRNSLQLALCTAVVGTAVVFMGAYVVEKTRSLPRVRQLIQTLAATPMAVPGLVLGLAYIFFFNHPANPLGVLYGSMPLLVLVTVVHFYSVTHFTMLTALKQVDDEFEAVSDSLKASRWRTLSRVTLPLCLPAVLDVSIYYFLSAMTTVSAVVFLYSNHTQLASISVLNMDDAGEYAHAIAMACVISATCIAARLVHAVLTRGLASRSQRWKVSS